MTALASPTGAELFEAIDNEIIAAGGTDRVTFIPVAPELLEGLVGQCVKIVGVQQETGHLPALVLRSLAVDEVAGEMLRQIGGASNERVREWARRLSESEARDARTISSRRDVSS
jgi:hypothetical protein